MVIALRVMETMVKDVAGRVVPVYGNPEGVIVALVPNSFALQDLLIPALAPKAQAAARP
jgi:hypothetical protein